MLVRELVSLNLLDLECRYDIYYSRDVPDEADPYVGSVQGKFLLVFGNEPVLCVSESFDSEKPAIFLEGEF